MKRIACFLLLLSTQALALELSQAPGEYKTYRISDARPGQNVKIKANLRIEIEDVPTSLICEMIPLPSEFKNEFFLRVQIEQAAIGGFLRPPSRSVVQLECNTSLITTNPHNNVIVPRKLTIEITK